MSNPCFDIGEIISRFFMDATFKEKASQDDTDIAALISAQLDSEHRAIWDDERATMPAGVIDQLGHAIRTAAQNDLAFRFTNTPPDDVMGFARDRAIEVSFRYTETEIVARIAHTRRHPSWLLTARVEEPSRA